MSRQHNHVTFKPYEMNQPSLLPPILDELIPDNHLVRVVNRAIERIKLDPLLAQYKGGGTSSFHPKMMLKVLVYAYTQRIYTSRQIARAGPARPAQHGGRDGVWADQAQHALQAIWAARSGEGEDRVGLGGDGA